MFKLKANPTFTAKVDIPVPGGEPVAIECEFRHRTRTELDEWANSDTTKSKSNVDFLMEMLVGWKEVDTPFSKEAVGVLVENYMAAPFAIRDTYMRELTGARLGN